MKIITIEGIDKAGKHSQCKLLTERLQSEGYKVIQSEFHRYDTPTGQMIQDWLIKKWNVDQLTIELIMAADKQSQQRWFEELEDDGYDFLILDRYILSQIVYGTSTGTYKPWLKDLQLHMRKPDIDIIIDIPAKVSMTRKGKHNDGQNDRYEEDFELLDKVRNHYLTCSTSYSASIRKIVNGIDTIENIHNQIYEIVRKEFLT